jgi:hypothetical protein
MKKELIATLLGATLLALVGCSPPSGSSGGGRISGRVFDSVTGKGIPGATVIFGGYSDTTDALGGYTIEVEKSVNTVSGVFAAFKGLDYAFRVCSGISVDPTTDPLYDIGMYPINSTGYDETVLSGKIYNNMNEQVGDGASLTLFIVNEDGGCTWVSGISYDYSGGTGYSAATPTFGSDCLVIVRVEDGGDVFQFYLTHQDLTVDQTDYDLAEPASGYTSVTVSGTQGTTFQGHLVAWPNGMVFAYAAGDLSSSSQATFDLYNPSDFPMMWWTLTSEMNVPGPGDLTVGMHAQEIAFSDTISLPAPPAFAGPAGTVDGATAAWDGSTISFHPVDGADGYQIVLQDNAGCFGAIWLPSSGSITLPSLLVSTVLELGTGWDMTVWPSASPDFDPQDLLGQVIYSDMSEGGVPFTEFEAVVVQTGVTKVDLIN